jgi:hypothetical protein
VGIPPDVNLFNIIAMVKGTSIKSGYFRLHSELFISRQGSHVIASYDEDS